MIIVIDLFDGSWSNSMFNWAPWTLGTKSIKSFKKKNLKFWYQKYQKYQINYSLFFVLEVRVCFFWINTNQLQNNYQTDCDSLNVLLSGSIWRLKKRVLYNLIHIIKLKFKNFCIEYIEYIKIRLDFILLFSYFK